MCGVFGVYDSARAAEQTYVGLDGMQHRAKEFAGIVTFDGKNFYREAGAGIVQNVFAEADNGDLPRLGKLHGRNAIGHIRYSTREDDPKKDNTQPVLRDDVAISHNGNITNDKFLRAQVSPRRLKTSLDTEVLIELFLKSKAKDPFGRVYEMVRQATGSYSLAMLYQDMMIAVRDPWSNRPLHLGQRGSSWYIASETVAFSKLDITPVREVLPGEILLFTKDGQKSMFIGKDGPEAAPVIGKRAKCIFEPLYYAHPESTVYGQYVVDFRIRAGQLLSQNHPADGDVVLEVPDSAKFFAFGWGEKSSKAKYVPGILRSHYVGRTFIEGLQAIRVSKAALKFVGVSYFVKDKVIILIDDSIVRLTTMPVITKLLRRLGAKEIHCRIPTPKIKFPCHYGIDTPTRKELTATDRTTEEIRRDAGLDTLEFSTIDELKTLVPDPENYCFACMTGVYPIPIPDYEHTS